MNNFHQKKEVSLLPLAQLPSGSHEEGLTLQFFFPIRKLNKEVFPNSTIKIRCLNIDIKIWTFPVITSKDPDALSGFR